ncbi:DNA repair protein complementing XP-G cells homolog [Caerostris extrusa]|uniref:DNA repair protein complementing XP-G cells homolog n=1 Tax=Caerostris extrusa TaxID=172846 RepID=A0AAV4V2P2_CAEEX|nr:DNA repair protein complementing XP-G cells homolog [Caerostris extrusa]
MGVLGLWQLLTPVGQPVALESLENKIFAVDISIWLNQALKGYRDSQGGSVANAHLLSLYSRLCKLLFYKIRPIIVFDGGFPELKRQTIINRNQRRAAVKQSSRDIGLKILTNYLASQKLLNVEGEKSNKKTIIKPKEKVRDEIFMLPPLPGNSLKEEEETTDNLDSFEWKFTNFSKEDIKYLNKIDIESDDFNDLPPDVKQEILSTLKESRKHRTWDQYDELPEDSNEFSSYQMKCLLKKRSLSQNLKKFKKTCDK